MTDAELMAAERLAVDALLRLIVAFQSGGLDAQRSSALGAAIFGGAGATIRMVATPGFDGFDFLLEAPGMRARQLRE